jgi:hypothetical protein
MTIYNDFLSDLKEWCKNNPITDEEKDESVRMHNIPWNAGKTGVQVAWNKDKKLSEEHKQKIAVSTSNALKGIPKSEEHKRKVGAASGKTRKGLKRGPYCKQKQEKI